jgi:fermentation-respiration switch protein FrsA (DUF1100 family)
MQNGQAAHAGVEDADRSRIHSEDCRNVNGYASRLVGRRLLLVVFVLAAALLWASAATAFSKQDTTILMDDGVVVAATLYLPDGPAPAAGWPGIVMFHGLGGKRGDMNLIAENSFANQGYAVLTFDTRGHGQSGGLFSLVGERELSDYRALFTWLGSRPDVDESHIGAWGISLGGGAVWRSLVAGIPFAAAAVVETWTDLYRALLPQNLSKSGAVYAFLNSVPVDRIAPEIAALRTPALSSTDLPALRTAATPRSSLASLGSIRTPVYLFQGRRDFVFGLEQGIAAFQRLAGPKRLYIGDFGHAPSTFPGPDVAQVFTEGSNWFARFLKGLPNGVDARPPVSLAADPYRELAGATYAGLPPVRTVNFTLKGRRALGSTEFLVRSAPRTRELLETFGAPVVRVSASGTYPHLVAVLKAVTPEGREITVSEGGAKLALTAKPKTVSIAMISQATTIPRGSRLSLRLGPTSGDLLFIQTVPTGSRISIGDARIALPVLRKPISG